jgi:predicted metal-dependent phosphoesterase TrpH
MIIDLHIHEWLGSACSLMSVEDAIKTARKQGLDGICITNHDNMVIREAECLRTVRFPVFVGVEMTVEEGDIIAFGIERLPGRTVSAQAFIDSVNEQGGFCYAAHPFRIGNGVGEPACPIAGNRKKRGIMKRGYGEKAGKAQAV